MISTKDLPQGELQRYSANVNGARVRFLLYRKPDGKIASVFDACQICGGVGFYKGSTGIICKNCAAPINPQSVGQPGWLQSHSPAIGSGWRFCCDFHH